MVNALQKQSARHSSSYLVYMASAYFTVLNCTVSVLGRDDGYTVKYNPLPEGVPEGKARRNS